MCRRAIFRTTNLHRTFRRLMKVGGFFCALLLRRTLDAVKTRRHRAENLKPLNIGKLHCGTLAHIEQTFAPSHPRAVQHDPKIALGDAQRFADFLARMLSISRSMKTSATR